MTKDGQMLLDFPKPTKKKVLSKFFVARPVMEQREFHRPTWDELNAMARADEARPQMSFVQIGISNPDYDENYQHPKDWIPF